MKKRVRILIPVVIIAALATWLTLRNGQDDGRIVASGTVEVTEADLGFSMAGTVEEILVDEGDRVAEGQPLARLDVGRLTARRANAAAQLDAARARLREAETGARPAETRAAEAQVRAAEERHAQAVREVARAERLYEGGAISERQVEEARTALEVASAARDQATEALALVEEGPRAETIAALRASVGAAQAAVDEMDSLLLEGEILAPFDGIVTRRHREPGESVGPGVPALTLQRFDDRWVRIYIREDRIDRIGIGQTVQVFSDGRPTEPFDGRITFIATEAEFTPRNVQTREERIKLVYAVKVSLESDREGVLKPGVPVDVEIEAPAPDAS